MNSLSVHFSTNEEDDYICVTIVSNEKAKPLFEEEQNTEFYYDYARLLRENKMIYCNGYYQGASNGFVRIFTLKGRVYWITQAMVSHRSPDWKIHFSVHNEDVPQAFNLLAKLFFDCQCKFGMKAIYPEVLNVWPEHMRGREITMYIYRYYDPSKVKKIVQYDSTREKNGKYLIMKKYATNNLGKLVKSPSLEFPEFYGSDPFSQVELFPQDEVPWVQYREFIRKAEKILSENNIRPNGCADGDKPLGKYASLRNETFVLVDKNFIFPPNQVGYNGSRYKDDVWKRLKGWNTWINKKKDYKKLNDLNL
jgi:hypothetical protein